MVKKILLSILLLAGLFTGIRGETGILVTHKTYADSLVAGVVSGVYKIPMFYLEKNLTKLVDELKQNNITDIIIIGGPVVIPNYVEEYLKNNSFNVIRIWGVTRYETSAEVAKFFWNNSREAVIVTRELVNERANAKIMEYAQKAFEFASEKGIPIFITPPGMLDSYVASALVDLGVNKVYIFTLSKGYQGNLTSTLDKMNISYEVYEVEKINITSKNCTKEITIRLPENVNWTEIEEPFVGYRCIKIEFVNKSLNKTEIKERLNERIIEDAREYKGKMIKLPEILNKNLEKAIEKILEVKEKLNETCTKNPKLDICSKLDNITAKLDEIINKLQNITNDTKALKEVMEEYDDIQEVNWKIKNATGKFVEVKEPEKIVKDVNKRKVEVYARILNISEEDVNKWMPDPIEARKKLRNMLLNCTQNVEDNIKKRCEMIKRMCEGCNNERAACPFICKMILDNNENSNEKPIRIKAKLIDIE